MQIIMSVCSVIWLVGVGAMLIYTAVSFIKVHRLVRDSEHLRDNIYLCDNIGSPFVFGYIRPRIYIPKGVSEKDIEYIAAHENTHIRRGDHIIKLLATAALSIHWFNPTVWLSYRLMSKDMELSCDERAVRSFEGDVRREYANALLNMSLRQNRLYGLLGFGETGIKSRIKGVLSLKKPTVIATISAVILLAIAAVCLLTNAENSGITLENNAGSYSVAAITYNGETETRLSDNEYIQKVIDNINGARLKKIRENDLPDTSGGIYLDYAFRMYKSSDFTGEYDSFTVCRSGDVFYAVYESEGRMEYYKMSEKCYNELCGLLSDAPDNESDENNISENETAHISKSPSQIRNSVSYELDWSADKFRTVECCDAEITIPCKLSDIDKRFKTDIGTFDTFDIEEGSYADLYFNNELVGTLMSAENGDITTDDVKAMSFEVFSIDGLTETSTKEEIQNKLGKGNDIDTELTDAYFSGSTAVMFNYFNGKTSLFVCAYDENETVLVLDKELERELEFCLSYITDYWNDLMKIGDFYPEKYISDPDMIMYANAKKKANEDTLGNGVISLEAKSGIGKVLSGITDEGRIWLSFTYDIELTLEDGTTDNEHYNGYKANFELEGSGDYMKVYRQYDMWGAWGEELGIEGTYDEPSDLQYVDIIKARENIR